MIRAVLFDAVGTLMRPTPSATAVYAAAGMRHGSTLDKKVVAARFKHAFARQESLDRDLHGDRTSEARERDRWEAIVAEVFPCIVEGTTLFEELWRHFGLPESWTLFDDVAETWRALGDSGLTLGVASNFDARLLRICAELHPLADCQQVFVSSLVGWRKPNREFFTAIERTLMLPPEQLLLVGDDLANDYAGARAAGWHAVLVDRSAEVESQSGHVPREHRITTLAELPRWLKRAAYMR